MSFKLSIYTAHVSLGSSSGFAAAAYRLSTYDHPRHPEEKDIPSALQGAGGEELLEVGIFPVGPAQGRHGPKARREPSIQTVGVLFEAELLVPEFLSCPSLGFFRSSPDNPRGLFALGIALALENDPVRGNSVTPPYALLAYDSSGDAR